MISVFLGKNLICVKNLDFFHYTHENILTGMYFLSAGGVSAELSEVVVEKVVVVDFSVELSVV